MHDVIAAGRPRCLAVAACLTAALWGVAAGLARAATADGPVDATGTALTRLCLLVLAGAALWAWLQAMAGVRDAWAGAQAGRGGVRRLALVACGAALAGSLTAAVAGPAGAAEASHATGGPHAPRGDGLDGLPLPERAEGAARRPTRHVVVRAGDCLWSIAAHDLGPRAPDREVEQRWHRVYAANRAVIGPDPDLLLPGQVLTLPEET